MDGILKQERTRHAGERELDRQRIAELENQVTQLAAQPRALSPAAVFDQEYLDEAGTEQTQRMLAGLEKVIDARVEAAVTPMQRELRAVRERESERGKLDRQRRATEFNATLSAAVPGWETWAVGEHCDPRLVSWLEQRVTGTRRTRRELMMEAQQAQDADAVAEMLQEFLRSLGAPVPSPVPRLIPSGSTAGDRPPPVQPEFTRAYVEQFRRELAQGKYRGRGKEALGIHQRIMEAFKGGRIAA